MIPFSQLPHLRLAIVALMLAEESDGRTNILPEDFEVEIEKWCEKEVRMHDSLGDCRSFLRQFCPLRYNHSCKSRDASYVIDLLPAAGKWISDSYNPHNAIKIFVDKDHYKLRGKSGKKKEIEIAKNVSSVVSRILEDEGFRLEHSPEAFYFGISGGMAPVTSLRVECAATEASKAFALKLVSALVEKGVTIVPNDDGDDVKVIDIEKDAWVAVSVFLAADAGEIVATEIAFKLAESFAIACG